MKAWITYRRDGALSCAASGVFNAALHYQTLLAARTLAYAIDVMIANSPGTTDFTDLDHWQNVVGRDTEDLTEKFKSDLLEMDRWVNNGAFYTMPAYVPV